MPLWSVVEPTLALPSSTQSKSLESNDKKAISTLELQAELKRLVGHEKLSLKQAATDLSLSVTTVRRVCRTLGLARYAPGASKRGALSRSSQVPFGWIVEHGALREAPAEMKWVQVAKDMRAGGQSYHAIARYLQERGVPTKNGGRWYAKTISQILDLNSRMRIQRKGK